MKLERFFKRSNFITGMVINEFLIYFSKDFDDSYFSMRKLSNNTEKEREKEGIKKRKFKLENMKEINEMTAVQYENFVD